MRSTFKERLEKTKSKSRIPEKFIDVITTEIMEEPILLNKHHVMCRITYLHSVASTIETWKESSRGGKKAHDFQQSPILVTVLGGQEPLTSLENLDYLKTQIETWVGLQQLKDKIATLPISYKFPFFTPTRQERIDRLNQWWASLDTRLFALLKTEKDSAKDNPAEFDLVVGAINELSFTVSMEEKIEHCEEKKGEFERKKEERLKEIKTELSARETQLLATFDPENTMSLYETEHHRQDTLACIDKLNKEKEALSTLTYELKRDQQLLKRTPRSALGLLWIAQSHPVGDEMPVLTLPTLGRKDDFL